MDDGLNLDVIERWKSFLDSSGIDLFEAIEAGIKVAVWYQPDEFLIRRDQIAELLFKKKGDTRGSGRSCFEKPQTLVSYCQNKDRCLTTGSLVESASMLHGSSCTEEDAYSNIIKMPKSCSGHEEQAKAEPILVSTCMPADTSKTEKDKPKTRTIIKIKPYTIHESAKQFPITEDIRSGQEGPLKKNRKCDEAYQISTQTKTPVRGLSDESANPNTFRASASAFSRRIVEMKVLELHEKRKQLPNSEDVQNEADKSLQQSNRQQTTRNAELRLRCRKRLQFNLGIRHQKSH